MLIFALAALMGVLIGRIGSLVMRTAPTFRLSLTRANQHKQHCTRMAKGDR